MRRLSQIVRKYDDVNRFSRRLCANAVNRLNTLYVVDYVDINALLNCANDLESALSDDVVVDVYGPDIECARTIAATIRHIAYAMKDLDYDNLAN